MGNELQYRQCDLQGSPIEVVRDGGKSKRRQGKAKVTSGTQSSHCPEAREVGGVRWGSEKELRAAFSSSDVLIVAVRGWLRQVAASGSSRDA